MAKLKVMHGEEKVEGVLSILLVEASMAFETQFDEEQAMAMSAEIQNTFYFYSLEDCYFILQQMKQKKQYGKLTENKIMAAFAEHEEERTRTATELSWNEHLSNKENPNAEDRDISMLNSPVSPGKKLK